LIASLELGFVLFEIIVSICICRYDWGNFYFIQPHEQKSHQLMSTHLLPFGPFSWSLLLHLTCSTLGLYIFLIFLSRSSGATLLFKLGLLWRLVHLGFFISGQFRRNCDSKFLIHILFTCILLLLLQKKKSWKEKRNKRGKEKKERKKEKRKGCE